MDRSWIDNRREFQKCALFSQSAPLVSWRGSKAERFATLASLGPDGPNRETVHYIRWKQLSIAEESRD